ncbi:putative DNA repair protein [Tieghemostelium lacteum]|uniref:Putative DNA repair protein n=1 Tax=Tieghemostelium lacteum TaxID=361077 RepID=A0A151Z912_TIELA|nr:putative DNA repair protein [Tieghemostelium lacteum]|eukprot:KYQ90432.1 putative DNA repair protein [Tieghemostelium lacteum]
METEEDNYLDIKYFQTQLINNDIFLKFSNSEFNTVDLILFSDIFRMHKMTTVALSDIQKIQINLQKIFASIPINAQQHYYERCNMSSMFSTGSDTVDELLGGGLLSGEIVEIFGSTASGKTQLAMNCTLSLAMQYKKNVIYIDSSSSFSPSRIVEMYNNNVIMKSTSNMTDDQEIFTILDRIKLCSCYDATLLFELLNQLSLQLENEKRDQQNSNTYVCSLKMVVIDSIGTILSPLFGGKQTQGHYIMMAISRLMKQIADSFQVVFLVINNTVSQTVSSKDKTTSDQHKNEIKSALGESWLAISNHQLMIHHKYTDDDEEKRSISVEKSTRIKNETKYFPFTITSAGIS